MEPQPGGAPGPAGLGFEAQLARFSIAGEESPSPEPRFPPPPEESRVFKPICTAPLTGTTSSGLTSSTATGEAAAPGSSSPATQDQPAVVHEAEESEPGGAMDQPEANKADDESDDDEAEIVEESPTGRWLKRKEQPGQPGVRAARLEPRLLYLVRGWLAWSGGPRNRSLVVTQVRAAHFPHPRIWSLVLIDLGGLGGRPPQRLAMAYNRLEHPSE
eukprot:snap_masked-scaffold154_size301342-processed-gene-0.4 protein:Tk07760 transcript:snap_masked-scaffold154_size301342-processed-gene-0.4-mRNA-1 annotation:"hypothetical protein TcasGA2_TC012394"